MLPVDILRAPPVNPDMQPVGRRAGLPDTRPADLFGEAEAPAVDVGEGEVGQVHVADGPARGTGADRPAGDASAEKRELVAEPPTVRSGEMARIVPPFGPELVVRPVVARELVHVAGRRPPELIVVG